MRVYDKDRFKSSDKLGRATVSLADFHRMCLDAKVMSRGAWYLGIDVPLADTQVCPLPPHPSP